MLRKMRSPRFTRISQLMRGFSRFLNFFLVVISDRLSTFRATNPFRINPGSSLIWLRPHRLSWDEEASAALKQMKRTGVSELKCYAILGHNLYLHESGTNSDRHDFVSTCIHFIFGVYFVSVAGPRRENLAPV